MKLLKVGDRVMVYDRFIQFSAKVKTVCASFVDVEHDGFIKRFYRKQVRLLVKRKRREIWVNQYLDEDGKPFFCEPYETKSEALIHSDLSRGPRCIRFIETKEK